MLAEFVTALQALVVATVLPQVAKNLHGYPLYGYAFSGYLIAQFILTPLAGAWADRFGVRTVLLVIYPIIALGLLFSGSAPTMELFIAARCVEGAAGVWMPSLRSAPFRNCFPKSSAREFSR